MMLLKLCGIRLEASFDLCVELGVDLIGFNFVETSRRQIDIELASVLSQKKNDSKLVGVFLNPTLDLLRNVLSRVDLDYIQLHGDESLEFIQHCRQEFKNIGIIKALKISCDLDLQTAYLFNQQVDYLLLDGANPGSGNEIDVDLSKVNFDFILAGGVNVNNLQSLNQKYHPIGFDMASGIETNQEVDLEKIKEIKNKTMKNLKKYMLNDSGHFGDYGGAYLPENILPIFEELQDAFYKYYKDPIFLEELYDLYNNLSGRPTPLYHCKNLSNKIGGAQIYLKNEGLNHTGAHKINHCLGQALLAKRMGKKRIIAETGAGQHGVATATVAANLGLECVIYMGAKDYKRQKPNVYYMEKLGAKVVAVQHGSQVLKDAIFACLQDLLENPEGTYMLHGTVCGPHPYPVMNTYFQSITSKELKEQAIKQIGKLPDSLVACCGGGSNAMGFFYEFLDDPDVSMTIVEAGGAGIESEGMNAKHAARFQSGRTGVVEGFKSVFMQTPDGHIQNTSSISAGMDYPGVGPQVAYLVHSGRVSAAYALDYEVLEAYELLARSEGVFAALESAHALVEAIKIVKEMSPDQSVIFNMSGRGDKDLFIVSKKFNFDLNE